jgi:uncharacterized delta-60 repeat protein
MSTTQVGPRSAPIRRATLVCCCGLAAFALAGLAKAAPGDLDPSFGSAGKVTTDFGVNDGAGDVGIQPDGKIVAVGSSSGDFALARYSLDGSLDSSFGIDGKVTTDFGRDDAASGIAIQGDGKVVVAGNTGLFGGEADFAVARYNPDGSPDPSFGVAGKVTTDFASGDDLAFDVALQADGKIVVAGRADHTTTRDFALARYDPDGSLDASFGSGGKVTTDFTGGPGVDIALGVTIQGDGKIVAAGWSGPPTNFALARYNPDGSLDPNFGGGGKLTTDFGSDDFARDVAIQSDGKIVAAGWSGQPEFRDFALVRYNGDGSLDTGFDGDGTVRTDLFGGTDDLAHSVAIQANGKIVATGSTQASFVAPVLGGFGLARYTMEGSLDTSFGTGGRMTTDFGPGVDSASGVALQGDGKIVTAGSSSLRDFAVARYLGDSTAIEVSVDVRPGTDSNPINLRSQGAIPVAILSTDAFDATTVDSNFVCFGDDDNPSERDCTGAHGQGHYEDVNGDGRPDLLLHYDVTETGIDPGDTRACLTGRTLAGLEVHGSDAIGTL